MTYHFSDLPGSARLWIFPSSKKFFPEEQIQIEALLSDFLAGWTSNRYAFEIRYNRFLIVACDTSETALTLEQHDALSNFILNTLLCLLIA